MDLSPTRFDRAAEVDPSPPDLAMLLVGVAARQASSRTAGVQAELTRAATSPSRFAPQDGRFNAEAAVALSEGKDG